MRPLSQPAHSLRSPARRRPSAIQRGLALASLLGATLALAVPHPAAAQIDTPDENLQNYIVGGRAAGMGGAFTAIADDESGMFYNPAGLAPARRSSLSLTVSLYGYVHSRVQGALPNGADAGYSDFNIVPSTIGGVKKLSDRYTFAFGVFSPSSLSYKDQRRTADGNIFITSLKDESLWAGAAFAAKLSPRWSVGATVFGIYRSIAYESTVVAAGDQPTTVAGSDGTTESIRNFFEYRDSSDEKSYLATAVVGARFQASDLIALGASYYLPGYQLAGSGKYLLSTADSQADASGPRLDVTEGSYETEVEMPERLAIGIAAGHPGTFLVALDYAYRGPVSRVVLDSDDQPRLVEGSDTHNVNLGLEVWPTDRLALRAGGFTNRSTTPRDVIAGQANHVDEYGASLGLGILGEHTETTLGINATFGSGDGYALRYDALSDGVVGAVVPEQRLRAYFFFGTSYRF